MAEINKRVLDHEDVDSYIQTIVFRSIKHAKSIASNGGDPVFTQASYPESLQEGVRVYDMDNEQDGIEFLVGISRFKGDMKNASESFQELVNKDRFEDKNPGTDMAFFASFIYNNKG